MCYNQMQQYNLQRILCATFSHVASAVFHIKQSHSLAWDVHQKINKRHLFGCAVTGKCSACFGLVCQVGFLLLFCHFFEKRKHFFLQFLRIHWFVRSRNRTQFPHQIFPIYTLQCIGRYIVCNGPLCNCEIGCRAICRLQQVFQLWLHLFQFFFALAVLLASFWRCANRISCCFRFRELCSFLSWSSLMSFLKRKRRPPA